MFAKYICLNCGRIWRSGEILVMCPVCKSKPIKIKEGVNVKEILKRLKGGDTNEIYGQNKKFNRRSISS